MRTTRPVKQTAFIFSVFDNNKDRHLNSIAHDELVKYMIMNNIAHKPLSISDTKLGLYVEPNCYLDEQKLEEFVSYHCSNRNQTSYYKIDTSKKVLEQRLQDQSSNTLGKIDAVFKDTISNDDLYFYCPTMNEYFVIK